MSAREVMAPEVRFPVMFTDPAPVITTLSIEPPLITGDISVLLVKVSVAPSVTTTPEAGNAAIESTPVPPNLVGRTPVTALG